MGFFEGKGYSEEFVRNMTEVTALFESDDPMLTITDSADVICKACPNDDNGTCDSIEKVYRYDRTVSELCGVITGDMLHWSELSALVRERIVFSNRLSEVCNDCCWWEICSMKCYKNK